MGMIQQILPLEPKCTGTKNVTGVYRVMWGHSGHCADYSIQSLTLGKISPAVQLYFSGKFHSDLTFVSWRFHE